MHETHEERCEREAREQEAIHQKFLEDSKRHDEAVAAKNKAPEVEAPAPAPSRRRER